MKGLEMILNFADLLIVVSTETCYYTFGYFQQSLALQKEKGHKTLITPLKDSMVC